MKRIVSLLLIVFLSAMTHLVAQDFQGKAVYMFKGKVDFDFGGRKIPEEHKQRMLKRMKDAMQKTYVLNFNKTESIYYEEEKLSTPSEGGGGRGKMFASIFGGASAGKMYKNVSSKEIINATEFFGKNFLVGSDLTNFHWKLEKETKKIGKYTCFKATAVVKEKISAFSKDAEKGEKEVAVSVWYTPQIPVSLGPDKYWGLPGLILGVNAGDVQIVCTQVVMNVKEKADIKKPKSGKKITKEKFDKIVAEKTKEMRERFKNSKGGGRPGGGRPGGGRR
jgi:GLPGLI family protein